MALLPDQKFSTFQNGGDLQVGDIVVGLRGGINTRFDYTGELPSGVVVPISQGGTGATTASGARTNLGLGTISVQDADSINVTGGTLNGVTITNSTADLNSGTVSATPTSNTDIANKKYVDDHTATLHFLKPARVASTSNLSATYNNGSSGVGATLTASSNGAATGDGITLSLGDRKLFKDQTNTFENGLYEVSQVGDASNPAIYTRTTDFDEAAEIKPGDIVVILEGNTLEHTAWLQTADVTNIGSDAINFVQFAADFDNIVTIDGTQTITGDKTFTGTIVVPTPTADPDAANKEYVDEKSGFNEIIVELAASPYTWNKPAEFTADSFIEVWGVAGGGGSGGAPATGSGESSEGGGGGGGGTFYIKIDNASLGSSETVTVGAGGTAGPTGTGSGGTGGTTSFGSHASAIGADGGGSGEASSGNATGSRGAGGTATGGDLNIRGGDGQVGIVRSGRVAHNTEGGSSHFSTNTTQSGTSKGRNGLLYGGGATGALSSPSSSARPGGAGASGLVIIREYI